MSLTFHFCFRDKSDVVPMLWLLRTMAWSEMMHDFSLDSKDGYESWLKRCWYRFAQQSMTASIPTIPPTTIPTSARVDTPLLDEELELEFVIGSGLLDGVLESSEFSAPQYFRVLSTFPVDCGQTSPNRCLHSSCRTVDCWNRFTQWQSVLRRQNPAVHSSDEASWIESVLFLRLSESVQLAPTPMHASISSRVMRQQFFCWHDWLILTAIPKWSSRKNGRQVNPFVLRTYLLALFSNTCYYQEYNSERIEVQRIVRARNVDVFLVSLIILRKKEGGPVFQRSRVSYLNNRDTL